MTAFTLETVMANLWAQITPLIQTTTLAPTTSKPFAYGSRRIQMWGDVPATNKPAVYLYQDKGQSARTSDHVPGMLTIEAQIYIYMDAGVDQSIVPATALNNLFQAVWNVLSSNNPTQNTFNIPGTQARLRIDGDIHFESGDLTGNGLCLIPLKILVPSF